MERRGVRRARSCPGGGGQTGGRGGGLARSRGVRSEEAAAAGGKRRGRQDDPGGGGGGAPCMYRITQAKSSRLCSATLIAGSVDVLTRFLHPARFVGIAARELWMCASLNRMRRTDCTVLDEVVVSTLACIPSPPTLAPVFLREGEQACVLTCVRRTLSVYTALPCPIGCGLLACHVLTS